MHHLQEMVKDCEAWGATVHRVTELDTAEWLNNNTALVFYFYIFFSEPQAHIYVNHHHISDWLDGAVV